jgi:hypothetical protein
VSEGGVAIRRILAVRGNPTAVPVERREIGRGTAWTQRFRSTNAGHPTETIDGESWYRDGTLNWWARPLHRNRRGRLQLGQQRRRCCPSRAAYEADGSAAIGRTGAAWERRRFVMAPPDDDVGPCITDREARSHDGALRSTIPRSEAIELAHRRST